MAGSTFDQIRASHQAVGGLHSWQTKMDYRYKIPEEVMRRAGGLKEFAKDAAIASIRIRGGKVFSSVLIVDPNFIAAIEDFDHLPFTEEEVEAVFQSEEDLKKRSSSSWTWFTTEKS